MGLVHRPRILFLDEPTTGLDPEVRAAMWDEIRRLAARGAPHDPAHHPLPRGSRPPGRPASSSSTPAGSSPPARRSSSRPTCGETRSPSSSPTAPRSPRCARRCRASPASMSCASTSGPCTCGSPPAHRPSPWSSRPSTPPAPSWPRPPSPRPSLDDVYLRHTGRSFTSAERSLQEATHDCCRHPHRGHCGPPHPHLPPPPWWIAISLMQPATTFLFGSLFAELAKGAAFGGSYIDFLLPGSWP